MMNKPKTNKKGLIKYSLIIPVALVMIIINSAQNISAKIQSNNENELPKPVSITVTAVDTIASLDGIPENKVIVFDEEDASKVFDVVEVPPKYIGGEKALMKFLSENIKYPEEARKKNIQGRVVVQFIIDKTGKVVKPKVVRGVNTLLDEEALRVVSSMPNWTPGKQGGQNVSCKFFIPVNFKLDGVKVEAEMSPKSNKELPTPSYFILDGKEITKEEVEKVNKNKIKSLMILDSERAVKLYGEKAKDGALILSTTGEDLGKYVSDGSKNDKPYDAVDTPPSFAGGEKALMTYLAQNVRYPVVAQENGAMGKIIVKFIVSKAGKIQNAEVAKSDFNEIKPELVVVGYGAKDKKNNKPTKESIEKAQTALKNEALRVVNAMPDWIPGKYKGENVDVLYYIPINFKLQ